MLESVPHLLEDNLDEDQWKAMAAGSTFSGASTFQVGNPGKSAILRFNPDILKKHIKNWLKGPKEKNSFTGVARLEQAVNEGNLRPGQIIWGTVSLKHARDVEEGS